MFLSFCVFKFCLKFSLTFLKIYKLQKLLIGFLKLNNEI